MSQFDDAIHEQNRVAFLEQNQQILVDQIHHLPNVLSQFSTNQRPPSHPNFNLPQLLPFSEVASELHEFKMKLFQFLHGNPHTYTTPRNQLLYAGSLLSGFASQY